jgi:hypothetical protein
MRIHWWVICLSLGWATTSLVQAQWPRTFVKTTCLLAWTAPTLNSDASPLTDLDHFEVCVAATSGGTCMTTYNTPNAATTQASCATLNMTVDPNPYFVTVKAVDTTGNKSVVSNEQQLTVTRGRTFMRP